MGCVNRNFGYDDEVAMYTKEEHKKRINELYPVARDWMANKTPDDGLELVAKMEPVDAYILGRIIGGTLQANADMKEFKRAVSAVGQIMERREIKNGKFSLN